MNNFSKFKSVLTDNAGPVVRDPRLLMDQENQIQIFYAPFEYINPKAKIVLVGITPGPTQMVNANVAARAALLANESDEIVIKKAKDTAAFSGEPMRGNLIRQLDHWGFQNWLKIESTKSLFNEDRDLVQTTSLLRFPVFVNGEDYRGSPDMMKNTLLRKYLFDHFVKEVNDMSDALFLPLGPQVQKVLEALVREKAINANSIVRGLLHPSGNNTYRINYLCNDQVGPVPHATNPAPYNEGRRNFREQFLKLNMQAN